MLAGLQGRLDQVWNGPADLPRSVRLEWRLVAVRWMGVASLAPVLPTNLPSTSERGLGDGMAEAA